MAVVAGDRVILRGQTGMGLDEKLYGAGDAKAQAEQAMRNVETLLGEAGARMADVVKATVYVTDRAFLAGRERNCVAPTRATPRRPSPP